MAKQRTQQWGSGPAGRNSNGRYTNENNGRQQQRYSRNYGTGYSVADDDRYENEDEYQDQWGARGEYENDYDDEFEDEDDHRYSSYGRYEDEEEYGDDYVDDYEDEGYRAERRGRGRQGFASMDRRQVREIARKGGRASQGGSSYNQNEYEAGWGTGSSGSLGGNWNEGRRGRGGRGFASMDREEVRKIARRGGRHSHDNSSNGGSSNGRSNGRRTRSSSNGNGHSQGFGSMSRGRVREIARKGGNASHGGSSNGRSSGRGRSSGSRSRTGSSRSRSNY